MSAASRLPWQLWQRAPAAVGRLWPTGAVALGDGAYLLRWPRLALAFPAAGLILGMLLGAAHPGSIYSYSFAVTATMAAAATLGAGIGLWILFGFVCADLAFSDRSSLPGFGTFTAARFTQALVPLALSYLVLGLLLVVIPLAANGFAVHAAAALRRAKAWLASCAVYVGVVAALGYAWAVAMPFMIRSLWSFAGQTPDTAAIQPIQGSAGALCGVMAAAAIGRCLLAGIATGFSAWPSPRFADARLTGGHRAVPPAWAGVPLWALLLTLLLGGLIATIVQGAVIFAALCFVLAVRLVIVPLIPRYPEAVRRVPVLARIGLCALIGYWLGGAVVQPAVDNSETSFTPLLLAVVGSFGAAALLLPALGGGRGGDVTHTGSGTGPSGDVDSDQADSPFPHPPSASPIRPAGELFSRARLAAQRCQIALMALTAVIAMLVAGPPPAFADNCGDLSDCSAGVKVALVVAAIAVIAIALIVLPEILAGGAVDVVEAAGTEAAEAAAGTEAAGVEAAEADALGAETASEAAEGFSEAEMDQALEYADTEATLSEQGPVPELDVTGKVHGELPDHIPDDWTSEILEQLEADLEASIQRRQEEQIIKGEDPGHRARINQELQLLRQILKRLSGS